LKLEATKELIPNPSLPTEKKRTPDPQQPILTDLIGNLRREEQSDKI
jgi:hypothetical protein